MKSPAAAESKNRLSASVGRERKGLVKPAGKRGASALLGKAPLELPRGESVLEVLLDERRNGR